MEDNNKKKLINETVTGRRLTPRRALRYVLVAGICGVAFGCGIFLTQTLTAHVNASSDKQHQEQTESQTAGSDVGDNNGISETETSVSESEPGSSISDNGTENESGGSSENGSDTSAAISSEDLNRELLSIRTKAAESVKDCLVTVNVTAQTNTWFDSEMESTETFSGVIISIDDKEILVLAPFINADEKKIKLVFSNESSADAYLKQSSQTDGLSVIAVSATEGISADTLDTIEAIGYGNTDKLENGTPVIAVGSPLGVIDSCAFGNIGYIDDSEMSTDCLQYAFYCELASNAAKGSFAVDYNGELIGVASSQKTDVALNSAVTRFVGIDSVERVIQSLTAGSKKPLLGIMGIDVDFGMKYSSIPEGVYVSEVLNGTPAYNAGIRHGDVIISIADRQITDVASMSRILNSLKPGITTNVRLMRGSVNSEYKEIQFELTLGER